jgi:hypothetical protein
VNFPRITEAVSESPNSSKRTHEILYAYEIVSHFIRKLLAAKGSLTKYEIDSGCSSIGNPKSGGRFFSVNSCLCFMNYALKKSMARVRVHGGAFFLAAGGEAGALLFYGTPTRDFKA